MVLLLTSLPAWFFNSTIVSAQQISRDSTFLRRQETISELSSRPVESKFNKLIQDLVQTTSKPQYDVTNDSKDPIDFSQYDGLIITNIKVISLDPFGTSLDSLAAEKITKTGNLLNRTHVETKERIIRKYLLFNIGESISGFRLGETERILRQLSFIGDTRISVQRISDSEAEIIVVSQDVFSLGAGISLTNSEKGVVSLYEKNISGLGHELEIDLPYDIGPDGRVGIGLEYRANNIARSFTDLRVFGVTKKLYNSYGLTFGRTFISAETKYAGALRLQETFMYNDLDTLEMPQPVEFTFQDYWFARSFMLNRANLSRLIFGIRYTNNNVYNRPDISSDSYRALQKYQFYLASISFSRQKFVKTNLIYNFGRTEDIPYGMLAVLTAGREFNEFAQRSYVGTSISWGNAPTRLGYVNVSLSADAF